MRVKIWQGSKEDWDNILISSNNLSIYQSYQWGEYSKSSKWKIYRLVAKISNEKNINLTILLKKLPLGIGIAWCQGINEIPRNIEKYSLQKAIKEALNINILYMRIKLLTEFNDLCKSELIKQGWKECYSHLSSNDTLIYNFTEDLQLSKNWKKNLKRSEKNKNLISLWSNPDAKIINHLYKKLEDYKKIKTQFTLKQINSLIKSIRKNLIVVVCENNEGKIISLRAAIIFNKKALDIFSISTFEGRKTYAGYGILWKLLELCKKRGVEIYDLGGVDKKNNSSVYNFKKGIGSIEYKYLGEFDWSNINFIRIIFGMIIKKMYN